jgi:hypothetical protein
LVEELSQLEEQRKLLQSRLPAHSISPSLMAELDELDEEIEFFKSKMRSPQKGSRKP